MKKILTILGFLLLTGCSVLTPKTAEPEIDQMGEQNQQTEENSQQETAFTGSMWELLGRQSVECTWDQSDEEGQSQGRIYVDGQRMAGNMSANYGGEVMNMQMMSDGEWMYQWSEGTNQGTKMNLDSLEQMSDDTQEPESEVESEDMEALSQDYNYECQPWQVNESVFSLPQDVEFTDLSQMMMQVENLPQLDGQNGGNLCAVCESLPTEARQACLDNCPR